MKYKRYQKNGFALLTALVMAILASPVNAEDHQELLDAICQIESNCDPSKVGDNGKAIGAYQIWWVYWKDATDFDPTIGGTYEDCKDSEYSRKIILAYWSRYAIINRVGEEVTDEDRARIHNGGPNGFKKECTKKYWDKIKNELH